MEFLYWMVQLAKIDEREACAKSLEDRVEATGNFQAKVTASYTVYCETEVEADSEAEARGVLPASLTAEGLRRLKGGTETGISQPLRN